MLKQPVNENLLKIDYENMSLTQETKDKLYQEVNDEVDKRLPIIQQIANHQQRIDAMSECIIKTTRKYILKYLPLKKPPTKVKQVNR